MLSKTDNELITDTNARTPMGELFRRFWLPVLLARELASPDCEPVRFQVLGESLLAFRDSSGHVGVVDAYCPHRGAPMFYGRNEEDGLRCVYHGWKFDVRGACVDLPSAPEGETYKDKIRIKAYEAVEAGDLVWIYMGPPETRPPFPAFEWINLPESHRYVNKFQLECNYLQAMEGDYDLSHANFLHSNLSSAGIRNPLIPDRGRSDPFSGTESPPGEPFPKAVGGRRVSTGSMIATMSGRIEETDSGVLFLQPIDRPGPTKAAMVAPWMMPIFCTAGTAGPNTYSSNMRVPIDNERIMFFRLRWSYEPLPDEHIREYRDGEWFFPQLIPGTWRPRDHAQNDYNIDREAQRSETYTGIRTFPLQDIAMMEDQWGPIADRTREHLTSMDNQVIYVRRRLLRTAKALASGHEPVEPWHPEAYRYHVELAEGGNLEEAVLNARAKSMESRITTKLSAIAP